MTPTRTWVAGWGAGRDAVQPSKDRYEIDGSMMVMVDMEGEMRMFVVVMEGRMRVLVIVVKGRRRMFVIGTRMVRWFVMVLVVLFPGIK